MNIRSEFDFIKATENDIVMLTTTRIQVLRAANGLEISADMSAVEKETGDYYEKAIRDGSHAAYLVFDSETFVGAGGISFYRVMPTFHNPSGYKAYIMNMYTHPGYRRRGIATAVLDLLVKEALVRGIEHISLEATSMGKPLYRKYGFVPMEDEMILPEEFVNGRKIWMAEEYELQENMNYRRI